MLIALTRIFLKNRFIILFLFCFWILLVESTNGLWYGDFWEHSAVVSALLLNLAQPQHPFFAVEASHAFFSPYALLVATLAKSLSVSAIDALAIFGILNFIIFCYGLLQIASTLSSTQRGAIAFYALLLTIFLWGPDPWGYSGFFHWKVLSAVLPYPSMFSMGLSLVAIRIHYDQIHQVGKANSIKLIILGSLILLSHPLTFIFLYVVFICQSLILAPDGLIKKLSHPLLLLMIIFGLGCLWPYYSLPKLLFHAGAVYHPYNSAMYNSVFVRIWPTICALPLIWWFIRDKKGGVYIFAAVIMLMVFLFGEYSHQYSYGRIIAGLILLIHLLQARGLLLLENYAMLRMPLAASAFICVAVIGSLFLGWSMLANTSTRSLTILHSLWLGRPVSNEINFKNIKFITDYVSRGSIVLADLETSGIVPSFAGKVIATPHPQAFISDDVQRREDVQRFFSNTVTPDVRHHILAKYHPDFLLINKTRSSAFASPIASVPFGDMLFENDQYILIRLRY
jgi:hypothetical protein